MTDLDLVGFVIVRSRRNRPASPLRGKQRNPAKRLSRTGPYRCGECLKHGHNRRTCPELRRVA